MLVLCGSESNTFPLGGIVHAGRNVSYLFLSAITNSKKTKGDCTPSAKFRLVENDLKTFILVVFYVLLCV